jgi:hypothetical protein
MTILVPSGDQVTVEFSPCSSRDVGVRERYAKIADGYPLRSEVRWGISWQAMKRTRIRQTARPFLVTVQKRDLRGLGERHTTDSGGRLGKAGTVESCLAADVGKYMPMSKRLRAVVAYN